MLPIHTIYAAPDEPLLELALRHDLSVYDASYLRLALGRRLSIATGDRKLQAAADKTGLGIIEP